MSPFPSLSFSLSFFLSFLVIIPLHQHEPKVKTVSIVINCSVLFTVPLYLSIFPSVFFSIFPRNYSTGSHFSHQHEPKFKTVSILIYLYEHIIHCPSLPLYVSIYLSAPLSVSVSIFPPFVGPLGALLYSIPIYISIYLYLPLYLSLFLSFPFCWSSGSPAILYTDLYIYLPLSAPLSVSASIFPPFVGPLGARLLHSCIRLQLSSVFILILCIRYYKKKIYYFFTLDFFHKMFLTLDILYC